MRKKIRSIALTTKEAKMMISRQNVRFVGQKSTPVTRKSVRIKIRYRAKEKKQTDRVLQRRVRCTTWKNKNKKYVTFIQREMYVRAR